MNGWVKLHRCLKNKPIFDNEKLLKVFVWCLLKATHKPHEQLIGRQKISLQPGQFITGRNKAGAELNMTPSTAWAYLKLLEDNNTIDINSNNKYSVVTIVNWSLYQMEDNNSDNKYNSKDNNKQTTDRQQIDTNKNDKNIKNNIYSDFVQKILPLYPGKKVKAVRDKKLPKILEQYSEEEILRCVKRYAEEVKGRERQFILNESTFWNGRYEDYLDKNYKETVKEEHQGPIGVPPSESILGEREEPWF